MKRGDKKKKRKEDRSAAPAAGTHQDRKSRREPKQNRANRTTASSSGTKDDTDGDASAAKRFAPVAALVLIAAAALVTAQWLWGGKTVDWETRRAVLSFLRSEPVPKLANYDEHEAWFFFENRAGGNAAKAVHSDDAEILLISPDKQTCNVGIVPPINIPMNVAPGESWTVRVGVDAPSVRDKNMTAEFRASIEYVAGVDDSNQERTATTPFCQRLVYDHAADKVQWVSCLGEPPPNCTKVVS